MKEILFPVFKIGIHKPQEDAGLVYYYYERVEHTDDGNTSILKYKIVDDKNIEGDTLAKRRLKLAVEGVILAKLTNAVYFLTDLVKLADGKTWFIDSLGKIFIYKKSIKAKLRFYKIKDIIAINTGGVIIEAVGINQRFKSLYKPTMDKSHVGILHFGMSMLLYGFYTQEHKATWRMI